MLIITFSWTSLVNVYMKIYNTMYAAIDVNSIFILSSYVMNGYVTLETSDDIMININSVFSMLNRTMCKCEKVLNCFLIRLHLEPFPFNPQIKECTCVLHRSSTYSVVANISFLTKSSKHFVVQIKKKH